MTDDSISDVQQGIFLRGSKYLWCLPHAEGRDVARVASTYNLPMPIAQTLIARGFDSKEKIDSFLFSSLEKDVGDPATMSGASEAVDRIEQAIVAGEQILVFGDYDVDGVTSAALMLVALLPLGAKVNFFLPHRMRDGYGLSTKIVERAARNDYKLIVTVDNGIAAFEPAVRARELGVDLIITDHHRPHDELPDACAVVNPAQEGCSYVFKQLAGVGVTFKVLSLLYAGRGLQLPPKVYELLLLGTIADVVPLLGENRFWVRYGLNLVNRAESLSLTTLKQNGRVGGRSLSSTDVAFSIAPQINALGRLEDARQAVKFLIGSDRREIEEVGRVLFELNEARKQIERSVLADVVAEIEAGRIDLNKENVIVAASGSWPPGVIGLAASRLVSAYSRPAILLHATKDGMLKGSCRSIPEFDIFEALQASSGLLKKFGGHAAAAGLSLKAENLPKLKEALEQRVAEQLTPFDLQPKLQLDARAQLADFGRGFMSSMELLEPFGSQNAVPAFCVEDVTMVSAPQLLKDAHVKTSIFADGVIKPLIFFNRPDLFQVLRVQAEEPFTVAVQVHENHWNGKVNVELTGLDIRLESTTS